MKTTSSDQHQLLIIFYRNPELGKVKTRLARTTGNEKALAIYIKLSSHTHEITEELPVHKVVCYSHFVDTEDHWPNQHYIKQLQRGKDLGEKMANAFGEAFDRGYTSVCIIGTDCLELTSSIIQKAFARLKDHDAVIGPAKDGGYYLLGMKKLHRQLFRNKSWSTSSVGVDTILDFKKLKLNFAELETLADIDEECDLPPSLRI